MARHKFTKIQSQKGGLYHRTSKEKLISGEHKLHGINLKIRLFQYELLQDKCCKCGWSEKREEDYDYSRIFGMHISTCHLDHIDGDNKNNRLDNLRILCPNCHSLTVTYCKRMKNRV